MLKFHPITLSDRDWVTAYYKARGCMGAQYSFAASMIWRKAYDVQVCEDEGYFFFRYRFINAAGSLMTSYRCPMGNGDDEALRAAIEKVWADSRSIRPGKPVTLHALPSEELARLTRMYGRRLRVLDSRNDFEYIYLKDNLATLPGSHYHGKRGFINKFMRTDWEYRPMTPDLIPQVLEMNDAWGQQNKALMQKERDLSLEVEAAAEAIRMYEPLGLQGGVLFQDGRVVAYTLGEQTNDDTFSVHFEKAMYDVPGAYPMITQQFAQRMDCKWVNREEDTGDPGLRKAKESWRPEMLLELTNAELDLSCDGCCSCVAGD